MNPATIYTTVLLLVTAPLAAQFHLPRMDMSVTAGVRNLDFRAPDGGSYTDPQLNNLQMNLRVNITQYVALGAFFSQGSDKKPGRRAACWSTRSMGVRSGYPVDEHRGCDPMWNCSWARQT